MLRQIVHGCAVGLAATALAATTLAGNAHADGPFGPFAGAWSGSGQVKMASGQSEAIKCKVYYTTKSANDLSLAIRCASPSAKIEMRANLAHAGGNVTGTWEERSYNASGAVTGKAATNHLTLSINGGGISGKLSLQVNGSSQTVSLSTDGSGFTGVNIQLSKG